MQLPRQLMFLMIQSTSSACEQLHRGDAGATMNHTPHTEGAGLIVRLE